MHTYNGVLTILGLACFLYFLFCVSVKVKLTVPLLCVCVHSAWKGRPQNDLYCVGWDVKPYSLTHYLLQHVLKMSSSSANAIGKRWHHSQTTGSTTWISQGSVATVLMWGGQNYSCLSRVFSWCWTPKIINFDPRCTELFKRYKKFELMLTRRAKAYSSFGSVV